MKKKVLIIQRFYYNFREGFFDYLSDIGFNFILINATTSRERVKVHEEVKNKSFIKKITYFFLGKSYVIFPFLFFNLMRINPKIIVTEGGQNTINNVQVLLYCRLFKCKYIIWDLGKGYANFGNSFPRRIYMRLYSLILKHSYYVYGYHSESKVYFKSLGIDDKKIVTLNNTIDTRKIENLKIKKSDDMPFEFNNKSKNEYIYFIYVGTLLKSKNIESMAELLRMLGKKYFLIIVGDGNPDYKKELEKIFYGTNHIFAGYKKQEQLKAYYNISSFSILPGLGGLSINQSMAFGVPVICKAADGAEKDLIFPDNTGYIYKDLNDAFEYIISKCPDDWKNMGLKSESLIYSKYSLENMMNKFIHYTNI